MLYVRRDSLYKSLSNAATIRFKTGDNNLLEKSSAEARSKVVENRLFQLNNEHYALGARLSSLLSSNKVDFTESNIQEAVMALSLDSSSSNSNPTLKYMKQQIEISDAQKKVEKTMLMPDISMGYFNQTLYVSPHNNLLDA